MNGESFQEFQKAAAALNERAQELLSSLKRIADTDLPKPQRQKFEEIHGKIILNPRLANLTRLTIEGGSRDDWLTKFTRATLSDVQGGLTSAHYHLHRVLEIEGAVTAAVIAHAPYIGMPKGMVMAGSGTRKLDAEYQAFVFALRRTLEYFAVSIGAYFKCKANRIRSVVNVIDGKEPLVVNESVKSELIIGIDKLVAVGIIPPKVEGMSVRDRMSHWESIPAGVLNVRMSPDNKLEVFFAGGGEDLGNPPLTEEVSDGSDPLNTLYGKLLAQIKRVEDLIFRTYDILLK